jgi:hypothetical protein
MRLVQRNPLWPREELGEIGATERPHQRGYVYFVRRAWAWVGNLLDAHIQGAMINGCFHAGSFSFFSLACHLWRHNVTALSHVVLGLP